MKNLIKREIRSTLEELNYEYQNSTIDDQKAFNRAVVVVGALFIILLII